MYNISGVGTTAPKLIKEIRYGIIFNIITNYESIINRWYRKW